MLEKKSPKINFFSWVENPDTRGHWLLAGIVILCGIIFRYSGLNRDSFWFDELCTLGAALAPLGKTIDTMLTLDSSFPLPILLAKGWTAIFGSSEVGARALTALFGSLAVVMAYPLGRLIGGPIVGLLTLMTLSLHHFHVWYSEEFRAYSMLAFFSSLSLFFAIRILQKQRFDRGDTLGLFLTNLFLAFTHNFGVVLIVYENLFIVGMMAARRLTPSKAWFGFQAFTIAIFSFWMPFLYYNSHYRTYPHLGLYVPLASLLRVMTPGDYYTAAPDKLILQAGPYLFTALILIAWVPKLSSDSLLPPDRHDAADNVAEVQFFKIGSTFWPFPVALCVGLMALWGSQFLFTDWLRTEVTWAALAIKSITWLSAGIIACTVAQGISFLMSRFKTVRCSTYNVGILFTLGYAFFMLAFLQLYGAYVGRIFEMRYMIVLLAPLLALASFSALAIFGKRVAFFLGLIVFLGMMLQVDKLPNFATRADFRSMFQSILELKQKDPKIGKIVTSSYEGMIYVDHYLKNVMPVIDCRSDCESKLAQSNENFVWIFHDLQYAPEDYGKKEFEKYLERGKVLYKLNTKGFLGFITAPGLH